MRCSGAVPLLCSSGWNVRFFFVLVHLLLLGLIFLPVGLLLFRLLILRWRLGQGEKRGGVGGRGGGDELHNDADTKRQSAEVTHFGGGHGARRPGEKRQVQVATPLIYTPPPHPCRCTPPAGICEHSSRRVKIFGIFCLG